MPSMTRATLVSRISLLVNDPSDQRFTAAQKQAEIEKAQEQFVIDTRCLKDVLAITVVDGTAEYALPTDIFDVMRVAHKGLKIESVSAYELDLLYKSDWSVTRGTPTRYYIDLDPNNKKIHFFPIPQAADAGANMTMEYLKIPPALSADGSIPLDGHTLLTPYHDAIAYWAAASLLNILPDQSALVMISQYENKYIKYVDACIENFDSMGRQRPLNIYRGRNPYDIGK
jgi:hypothetical protein